MTISQSRYGANAEVGRNYEKPKQDKRRAELGVVLGAGGVAGGAGLAQAGNLKAANAKRATGESFARFRELSKPPRIPKGDPSGKGGSYAKMPKEQMRAKIAAGKESDRLLMELPKQLHTAKKMNRAGLAIAGGSALLAGASGVQAERKRGTLGYKRKTLAEHRLAQINAQKRVMEESKAEGDRYRRMNGM